MSVTVLIFFCIGLVLLIVGADLLVAGASRIAGRLGISPLVIGLTIVAFGTSAPELAVSTTGALTGQADLALGNVVGSSIFNVLFILGMAALVAPLTVQGQLVRIDVPIMIAASGLCWLFALDGEISRIDGTILAAGILTYTVLLILMSRRQAAEVAAAAALVDAARQPNESRRSLVERIPVQLAMIGGGLAMLVFGSRWLVDGRGRRRPQPRHQRARHQPHHRRRRHLTARARDLRARGVSRPARHRRRQRRRQQHLQHPVRARLQRGDRPQGHRGRPGGPGFDIPVMTAVAVACLPLFITGGVVSRWEGAVFVLYYIAYTVYLVLSAQAHDALANYGLAMKWVVLPLTALTVLVVLTRELRGRRSKPA
jgi:cation:H+ antiporter